MTNNLFSATRRIPCASLLILMAGFLSAIKTGTAAEADSISQYGITWTFDKAYPVGQFINGDWWVVGPVTVVKVSPEPGPAPAGEDVTSAKSIYGDVMLIDDKRMRNGSMIVAGPDGVTPSGFNAQGYDSRSASYDSRLSISYPRHLLPGQSLISSRSAERYKDGVLATPCIIGELFDLGQMCRPEEPIVLDTAAVLTCLDREPPADAFRPPYAGKDKPIYQARDIQWSRLPALKPTGSMPDFSKMARAFERPWLDHCGNYLFANVCPAQNVRGYGGVYSYLTGAASLMLMTEAPREQKEKLMIGMIQLGIDLHGLAQSGRQWFSDGGIWSGRKWPILFASLMLDKPVLRSFPPVDPQIAILYDRYFLDTSSGSTPTTLFQEDLDTYYGQGADGQSALWQIVFHTRPRTPYFEKPFEKWTDDDKFSHRYFWVGADWSATALAALYLKAKSDWNHDAFFDYCDWYMTPGQARYMSTGEKKPIFIKGFFREMWDAYRSSAPEQPDGRDNLKWVWSVDQDGKIRRRGHLVPNPKPNGVPEAKEP